MGLPDREVKFKARVDSFDFHRKLRQVEQLLRDGYPVKLTVMFRGSERHHPELGRNLLRQARVRMVGIATVGHDITTYNRHMTMVLTPRRWQDDRSPNWKGSRPLLTVVDEIHDMPIEGHDENPVPYLRLVASGGELHNMDPEDWGDMAVPTSGSD